MSNSGDNGSWDHQRNDIYGQQPEQGQGQATPGEGGQDPYGPPQAQDPFGQTQQDPYGQQPPQDGPAQQGQDPWAQPHGAQDPYAQPSASSAPSASEPYGQPGYGQTGPAFGPPPPGYGPTGGPAQGPAGDVGQSRLLVGLLGIFLGAFGVHRFLMGYTTIGIIQVCITVLSCGTLSWVSGIWGLIEGIMVLAKSEQFQRDAHGRPLTD